MTSSCDGVAKACRTIALCAVVFALGAGPALAHGEEKHEQMPMKPDAAAPAAGEMMGGQVPMKPQTMPAAADEKAHKPIALRLLFPVMNSERGKMLFLEKGCVACHAVNGVGGHDATPLDAHNMDMVMSPFDFAAKMWAMAPYMIAAQEEALGEQILFTGDELADIIGFLHDDDAQHALNEGHLTARMRKMMDHQHGAAPAPAAHAEEIGHGHDGAAEAGHHDN